MHIYLINHERFQFPIESKTGIIRPFIVGEDDSRGENIQSNKHFLEARCHYWVWKNLPTSDHIGFHMRRRVLLYPTPEIPLNERSPCWQLSISQHKHHISMQQLYEYINYLNRLPIQCWDWVSKYDVVIAAPEVAGSIRQQYINCHRKQDWDIFEDAARKAGFQDFDLNYIYVSNLFIMRRELFDDYMQLWWDLIPSIEPKIDFPPEYDYQHRILGYLTERLLTLWLYKNRDQRNLKVMTLPILFGQS